MRVDWENVRIILSEISLPSIQQIDLIIFQDKGL